MKKSPVPSKEVLEQLYCIERVSTNELLKRFRLGPKTLSRIMEEYGIKTRPRGTNQNQEWDLEKAKAYFSENGCELLANEYQNASTPMPFRCSCGNVSEIRLSVFQKGSRCIKCAAEQRAKNQRFSIEDVRKMFAERGAVLLSETYTNAATPLQYICPKCGEVAWMSLSNFKRGYGCRNCKAERFKGENNPHYNPCLSDDDRDELGRYESRYKEFRRKVFARDRKCVICGSTKRKVVHHLDGYSGNPEKRTDVENAVCLCEKCHKDFHSRYGYGNNTANQFQEYLKTFKGG